MSRQTINKLIRTARIGIALTAIIFLSRADSAQAQNNIKLSTSEDVAVAFYKTAGLVPPFEKWIKGQKPYIITPLARRDRILENEKLRLNKIYRELNPKSDLLNIRTQAKFILTEEENLEKTETVYFLRLDFGQDSDIFYLPYSYNDQNIMIVPDKFERFQNLRVTKAQSQYIARNLSPKNKNPIIIRLRANKADITQPYTVDGLAQWYFNMDVISMESWNKSGQLIWEYTTDGYLSPNEKQIKNLYLEDDTFLTKKGRIKPLQQ